MNVVGKSGKNIGEIRLDNQSHYTGLEQRLVRAARRMAQQQAKTLEEYLLREAYASFLKKLHEEGIDG